MIDSLLQQTTIPLLEQVTVFAQHRHQVLAGNIANVDTPGYRTRDLPIQDFEQALQQAVQARREGVFPAPRSAGSAGNVNFPTNGASAGLSSLSSLEMSQSSPQTNTRSLPLPASRAHEIKDYFPAELYRTEETESRNVTFHDGGNRSIELESMEMVKNTSLQSFAIEVMLSQMRMLETVISERVI